MNYTNLCLKNILMQAVLNRFNRRLLLSQQFKLNQKHLPLSAPILL